MLLAELDQTLCQIRRKVVDNVDVGLQEGVSQIRPMCPTRPTLTMQT